MTRSKRGNSSSSDSSSAGVGVESASTSSSTSVNSGDNPVFETLHERQERENKQLAVGIASASQEFRARELAQQDQEQEEDQEKETDTFSDEQPQGGVFPRTESTVAIKSAFSSNLLSNQNQSPLNDYIGMGISLFAATSTLGVAAYIGITLAIAGIASPVGPLVILTIAAAAALAVVGVVCVGLAIKFYRDAQKHKKANKIAEEHRKSVETKSSKSLSRQDSKQALSNENDGVDQRQSSRSAASSSTAEKPSSANEQSSDHEDKSSSETLQAPEHPESKRRRQVFEEAQAKHAASLDNAFDKRKAELEKVRAEKTEAEATRDSLRKETSQLAEKLGGLKEKIRETQQDLSAVTSDHQEATARMQKLTSEITRLEKLNQEQKTKFKEGIDKVAHAQKLADRYRKQAERPLSEYVQDPNDKESKASLDNQLRTFSELLSEIKERDVVIAAMKQELDQGAPIATAVGRDYFEFDDRLQKLKHANELLEEEKMQIQELAQRNQDWATAASQTLENDVQHLEEIFFEYHAKAKTEQSLVENYKQLLEKEFLQKGIAGKSNLLREWLSPILASHVNLREEVATLPQEQKQRQELENQLKALTAELTSASTKLKVALNELPLERRKEIEAKYNIPTTLADEVWRYLSAGVGTLHEYTKTVQDHTPAPVMTTIIRATEMARQRVAKLSEEDDNESVISLPSIDSTTSDMSEAEQALHKLKNEREDFVRLVTDPALPLEARKKAAQDLCEFLVSNIIAPLYEEHRNKNWTMDFPNKSPERNAKRNIARALAVVYSLLLIIGEGEFKENLFRNKTIKPEEFPLPLQMIDLHNKYKWSYVTYFDYYLADSKDLREFMNMIALLKEVAGGKASKGGECDKLAEYVSSRGFIAKQMSILHHALIKPGNVESKSDTAKVRYEALLENVKKEYIELLPSATQKLKCNITLQEKEQIEQLVETPCVSDFVETEKLIESTDETIIVVKKAVEALGHTTTISEAARKTEKTKKAEGDVQQDGIKFVPEEEIYSSFRKLVNAANNFELPLNKNVDYVNPTNWIKARKDALVLLTNAQEVLNAIKARNEETVSGAEEEHRLALEAAELTVTLAKALVARTQEMLNALLSGQFNGVVVEEQESYVKQQLAELELKNEEYNQLLAILPVISQRNKAIVTKTAMIEDVERKVELGENTSDETDIAEIVVNINSLLKEVAQVAEVAKENASARMIRENKKAIVKKVGKFISLGKAEERLREHIAEKIVMQMLNPTEASETASITSGQSDESQAKIPKGSYTFSIDDTIATVIAKHKMAIDESIKSIIVHAVVKQTGLNSKINKLFEDAEFESERFVNAANQLKIAAQEDSLEKLAEVLEVNQDIMPKADKLISSIKKLIEELNGQSAEIHLVKESAAAALATVEKAKKVFENAQKNIIAKVKQTLENRVADMLSSIDAETLPLQQNVEYSPELDQTLSGLVTQFEEVIELSEGIQKDALSSAIITAKNLAASNRHGAFEARIKKMEVRAQALPKTIQESIVKLKTTYDVVGSAREAMMKAHNPDTEIKAAFSIRLFQNQERTCEVLHSLYDYYVKQYGQTQDKSKKEVIFQLTAALMALAYQIDTPEKQDKNNARDQYKKIRTESKGLEARLGKELRDILTVKFRYTSWTLSPPEWKLNSVDDAFAAILAVQEKMATLNEDGSAYALFLGWIKNPQESILRDLMNLNGTIAPLFVDESLTDEGSESSVPKDLSMDPYTQLQLTNTAGGSSDTVTTTTQVNLGTTGPMVIPSRRSSDSQSDSGYDSEHTYVRSRSLGSGVIGRKKNNEDEMSPERKTDSVKAEPEAQRGRSKSLSNTKRT
jgi:hypothetical protein